jgi:hypothetical protein
MFQNKEDGAIKVLLAPHDRAWAEGPKTDRLDQ